jgi:NAD+ synthase
VPTSEVRDWSARRFSKQPVFNTQRKAQTIFTMATRLRALDKFDIREPKETIDRLARFIQTQAELARAKHLIVGMSGGLDSSVTAALCAIAVGGNKVLGLCMPEKETLNPENIEDARRVARQFKLRFELIDITPFQNIAKTALKPDPSSRRIAWGNIKARIRATILYYKANISGGLVVGTGDKSESMLGYFTKYGDGACDMLPLGDVYKTSVRDLAKHLNLPRRIYTKMPSPELWPGQTAEKELGLSYDTIDQILWALERWLSPKEIATELSLPMSVVSRVSDRWLASEHKRRIPLTSKIGFRTVGMDLRLPYVSS